MLSIPAIPLVGDLLLITVTILFVEQLRFNVIFLHNYDNLYRIMFATDTILFIFFTF